jgi:sRNA-binding carbon storage regulator CsrA
VLVHKRRPGQGIVLDGLFRVSVLDLVPEVWLRLESLTSGADVTVALCASHPGDRVRLGVRRPASLQVGENTTITTGSDEADESELYLSRPRLSTVEIDGLVLVLDLLEGGEHDNKALVHLAAPGIVGTIDLATLSRYSYAVDVAVAAPQSVRIYRTETWSPTADTNVDAATWSPESSPSLDPRPAKSA